MELACLGGKWTPSLLSTDEGNPWHARFSEVDSNCIFLFYGFLDPGSLFQNLYAQKNYR